ncbi:MAG: hypothetical protein JWR85_1800 [Marmoricola sp.]|nr:hypothetical protein [Marmoricola sp.]
MFFNYDWDPDGMMDGSYGGGMMGNGGVWIMLIFGLLLVVLVGIAAFWAIAPTRTPTSTGPGVGQAGSARDVLDLRLARGEISSEEYNSTRTLLGQ